MLNRKRLLELITAFSKMPDNAFDMSIGRCGSVGCIAGWHYEIFALQESKDTLWGYSWPVVRDFAIKELGLNEDLALALFTPTSYSSLKRADTRQRAINEMIHLFNTGEVRRLWFYEPIPYECEQLNPKLLKEVCDESQKAA